MGVDYVPLFSGTDEQVVEYAEARGFAIIATTRGNELYLQHVGSKEFDKNILLLLG